MTIYDETEFRFSTKLTFPGKGSPLKVRLKDFQNLVEIVHGIQYDSVLHMILSTTFGQSSLIHKLEECQHSVEYFPVEN